MENILIDDLDTDIIAYYSITELANTAKAKIVHHIRKYNTLSMT